MYVVNFGHFKKKSLFPLPLKCFFFVSHLSIQMSLCVFYPLSLIIVACVSTTWGLFT